MGMERGDLGLEGSKIRVRRHNLLGSLDRQRQWVNLLLRAIDHLRENEYDEFLVVKGQLYYRRRMWEILFPLIVFLSNRHHQHELDRQIYHQHSKRCDMERE